VLPPAAVERPRLRRRLRVGSSRRASAGSSNAHSNAGPRWGVMTTSTAPLVAEAVALVRGSGDSPPPPHVQQQQQHEAQLPPSSQQGSSVAAVASAGAGAHPAPATAADSGRRASKTLIAAATIRSPSPSLPSSSSSSSAAAAAGMETALSRMEEGSRTRSSGSDKELHDADDAGSANK
jgi:hypothetical protein